MTMRALFLLVLFSACEPAVTIGAPDGGSPQTDGGSDAGTSGPQIVGGCPRVILPRTTDITFSADTSTLSNLVISPRLEWRDAPDDALEFTSDTAGRYRFELSSANTDLAVSLQNYQGAGAPFTRADCGPSGVVVSIDGVYSQELDLTAGQTMVVFISAPYWAMTRTGAYTLRIHRLP
jgi:hypothetical protein